MAKFEKKTKGQFQYHTECPAEGCGSSDAGAVYLHDDGSYSFTCWSCGHAIPDYNPDTNEAAMTQSKPKKEELTTEWHGYTLESVRDDLAADDLRDRKLPSRILELFGVHVDVDDKGDIDKHFYPTYLLDEGTMEYHHVGYRIRSRFEEYHREVKKKPELLGKLKNFSGKIGDVGREIVMFGEWLYAKIANRKRLIIMEGEIDCMTARLILEKKAKNIDNYCVVSMPSGANIAGIQSNFKFINSFEEIYLCMDNDEAGRKLCEAALKVLPANKVRLMKYPDSIKDLSDMWKATKSTEMRNAVCDAFWQMIWNAESYCPAGVRSFASGFQAMKERGQIPVIPFPESFGDLNTKTYGGFGLGEITTIAAASSVGKSAFVREMIYKAWKDTDYNIGIIPLEDSYEEMMEMLCSVHMNTQLNEIDWEERDWDAIEKAHSELSEGNRIHIIDHQGAVNAEKLLEFIDFLVMGLNCKMIVLDPVTLALSRSDTNEDEILSEILNRVKRHRYAHINVCHVRKNGGGQKANSEGAEISEEDIKGSGAYFQISMNNILLSRNKLHENAIIKNTTMIKLSKCRRHGKSTGLAGFTYYNGETGRLEKGRDPRDIEEALNDDEALGYGDTTEDFVIDRGKDY